MAIDYDTDTDMAIIASSDDNGSYSNGDDKTDAASFGDQSTGGRDTTVKNGCVIASDVTGAYFTLLRASNQSLITANDIWSNSDTFASEGSISLWFQPNGVYTSDQDLWNSENVLGVGFGTTVNKVTAFGTGFNLASTTSTTTDVWRQVIITWSATDGEAKLYFNSTLEDTDSAFVGPINFDGPSGRRTTIGDDHNGGVAFNGNVARVMCYHKVLDQTEVNAEFALGRGDNPFIDVTTDNAIFFSNNF